MIVFLFTSIVGLACALGLVGVWRTWEVEHSTNQTLFLSGTVPNPRPHGFLAGSVPGRTVSWRGKKFNATDETGVNVFDDGSSVQGERYPFATSSGLGLRDAQLHVLKIDYDVHGNPFWLRPILDEIVEVAPGTYLGKLHVRIIPGFPFTLAYFELKK